MKNRGNNMVLTKVHIYHPNAARTKKKVCGQKRLKKEYTISGGEKKKDMCEQKEDQ